MTMVEGATPQRGTGMTVSWRGLRNAALDATSRGWPVVPGTFLGLDRRWHGRDEPPGLCPIADTWQQAPVTDPAQAYEMWSQEPYSVLLVCGLGVDVLELPYRMLGLLCALAGEGPVVPIAVTGAQRRFLVFTATGPGTLSPDLTRAGVQLHTAGAWVALPPTKVEFLFPQRWWTGLERTTELRPAQEVPDILRQALLGTGSDDGDGAW